MLRLPQNSIVINTSGIRVSFLQMLSRYTQPVFQFLKLCAILPTVLIKGDQHMCKVLTICCQIRDFTYTNAIDSGYKPQLHDIAHCFHDASLLAFVVIWRIRNIMKWSMKWPNGNVLSRHTFFVTIHGLMWSSSVSFKHKMMLVHSNVSLVTWHHFI